MICVAGDARDDQTYARALGGERAALLLTDPPYCLLVRRRKGGDDRDKRRNVKIDRDPVLRFEDVRAYRRFTEEWLPKAVSHLAPAAPLAIWTNFLGREPIRTVAKALGYVEEAELVWAKWTSESDGNERLLRVYETALIFGRTAALPPRDDEKARATCVATGYHDPDARGEAFREHPNHKPFAALEPLVRDLSRQGDLVLDPFAGSGSIPAAALRLGRRAACSELDPEWAARVSERLGKAQGRPPA